jgi:hypothetical protein
MIIIFLKQDSFSLAHGFEDFSVQLASSIDFGPVANQEAEREREKVRAGTRCAFQRHISSDSLPLTRPHFLIAHSAMNSSMD